MSNPWKLPPREAQVMSCMADKGSQKVVAAELGIAQNTVQELVYRAKQRIGARTSMAAVVAWDRWARVNSTEGESE
jgi:DNA-binding CsgD family transcriptional regulator